MSRPDFVGYRCKLCSRLTVHKWCHECMQAVIDGDDPRGEHKRSRYNEPPETCRNPNTCKIEARFLAWAARELKR